MVTAKFKCDQKNQSESGYEVKLVPVVSGSMENEQFFKWTPYGEMKIGTVNESAAAEFIPGKEYYVDFTPAEE